MIILHAHTQKIRDFPRQKSKKTEMTNINKLDYVFNLVNVIAYIRVKMYLIKACIQNLSSFKGAAFVVVLIRKERKFSVSKITARK